MHSLHKFLDLPHPPQELIDSVDINRIPPWPVLEQPMGLGIFVHRHLENWHGYNYSAVANIRERHEEFAKWCNDNITTETKDAGVNYSIVVDNPNNNLEGGSTGAHTDIVRDYTLIYLLSTGGDNAPTVFYQEQGKPAMLPPKSKSCDFKKLVEIHRVIIPARTWCVLDSRYLHSVEYIKESRVAFQVGVLENHWSDVWYTPPDYENRR
jgi:hypothetical protein